MLAEHVHYPVPGHPDAVTRCGAVRATRENCRTMLAHHEIVTAFPGGAREVTKGKGEKCQLLRKDRTDFARMAVEAGCPIIPLSSIGVEDSFAILLDAHSAALRPLRRPGGARPSLERARTPGIARQMTHPDPPIRAVLLQAQRAD